MLKKVLIIIFIFLVLTAVTAIAIDKPIYTPVKKVGDLGKYVGKKVIVEGKISNIMWQHMMRFYESHPFYNYFDVDKSQIVVYTKKKIEEKGKIKVAGTVVELRGPKGKNTKVDETYVEYHILADAVTPAMYVSVKNAVDLKNYVDEKVVVEGKVSDKPWQHIMLSPSSHPVSSYFDIGKYQIVIYSKEMIETTKKIKVKGTVVKVSGKSKNPKPTKAGETYYEYHILVDKIEPIKQSYLKVIDPFFFQ